MTTHAFADATTLGEALRLMRAAAPDARIYYPGTGEVLSSVALEEQSAHYAAKLIGQGVGPGSLVALLLQTSPSFLTCTFGVLRAGAAATVLPSPGPFTDRATAVNRLRRIADAAQLTHVIADATHWETAQRLGVSVLTPDAVAATAALPHAAPDDLAFVQFTSGATSHPRGVMLTHRNVLAGLRAILISAEFTREDVLVQWIPTHHDMGLFGLLSQVLNGATAHVVDPSAFLRRPRDFLHYLSAHRATTITGPNFGYEILARALTEPASLELHRIRVAFNGAEPVQPATVTRVNQALGTVGFPPSAMYPCYGLAEATLAVTFPTPGRPPRLLHVERQSLRPGGRVILSPTGKALVAVGHAVHGMRLRIADEVGQDVPDGVVGEIQIGGDAVTTGYLHDPAATAKATLGPWFKTGDLGFLIDGDLFIAGRRKEMIIVHGQNYFPEDAESVAREVPGVFRGNCVACCLEDDHGETIGVIAETSLADAERHALEDEIQRRVGAALGLGAVVVRTVRPHWLTRTTSGKWQRLAARERLTEESGREPVKR